MDRKSWEQTEMRWYRLYGRLPKISNELYKQYLKEQRENNGYNFANQEASHASL